MRTQTLDEKTYDHLFLRYYPKVCYFIRHLVKSSEVAKDLAQDIFVKVWLNRDAMAEVESMDAYLFRAAKNSALNHLEHASVAARYEAVPRIRDDDRVQVEEEMQAKDLERRVKTIVEGMPEMRRIVFHMSREQYLKNGEIAQMLGLSEKTVKNHLTLALKQIKRNIND